jgi:hypothetical protein
MRSMPGDVSARCAPTQLCRHSNHLFPDFGETWSVGFLRVASGAVSSIAVSLSLPKAIHQE